jgi:diphthamide biosynthesis enzyme Dph1/Dph2-like protein
MNYDLELEKVSKYIKEKDAKLVCIQLPDGLKQHSGEIVESLESETSATIITWLGECFGACDIPLGLEQMKIDLLVQWGHNLFHKQEWDR